MSRPVRILLRVLYWAAVLAVSIVLVFLLIMLLESRDDSDIEEGAGTRSPLPALAERTR